MWKLNAFPIIRITNANLHRFWLKKNSHTKQEDNIMEIDKYEYNTIQYNIQYNENEKLHSKIYGIFF